MQRLIFIIIITLVMSGIILWYQAQPIESPTVSVTNTQSETIREEIEAIDIGDLDIEFQKIDSGIDTL